MSRTRASKPNRSEWAAHNDQVLVATGRARMQDWVHRRAAAVTAIIRRVASAVQSDWDAYGTSMDIQAGSG